MNSVEQAASYFKKGFNCSQALIATYGPELNLPTETALKIGAPFGAGMGCMAEVCGVVTGAFMVMGLLAGEKKKSDKAIRAESYRLANEFTCQFRERNGTVICRELLGCDISTPEGMKSAKDRKLFTTHCTKLVHDAAEIVSSILEQ
jgi:C_GCAxxG_C_C family probable redox protein